jgi:histidinol-phosphate aminotransferase
MTKGPIPQPGILDITPYIGGASKIAGLDDIIKLSSNENPYGPSEKAMAALGRTARQMHRYPSMDHAKLRHAIGGVHGLDPERIICGAGSDEIIAFLCQAYAGPGDEVIHTEHGFYMFAISARVAGASIVVAPERDRVVDVDAILAACTDKTRIVFIANPANPTATMISIADAARLAEGLPERALLVLDGAYAEFAEGYDGGAALVDRSDNVVMTRTFSKLYGLGGLRVGYGYGPKNIIEVLNRVRGPFNLSQAQQETAQAALQDHEYVNKCLSENARLRGWLSGKLADVGVPSDTSHANFLLARFADQVEAEACDDYLQTQGIIVRRVAGYKLPHCLRITIGDEPACRRAAHAIAAFKKGAK